MKGLILALMLNVCYLAVILIFLVVTACYLMVTVHYLVVTGSYFLLLVVTTSYCLLLLIPSFSMNELNLFPRSCKIAKVKLLFKKGSKTALQNYRSISLLPNPSKIVERIIYDQRQEFLSKNKILYRFHSIWFLKKLFH